MAKPNKYTPTSIEEDFSLALESILRWTNRQGYPAQKIKAIRSVAETALMRLEATPPKSWTPSYLTVVPDTDEHGTPVPAVMKKKIDKIVEEKLYYTPDGYNKYDLEP